MTEQLLKMIAENYPLAEQDPGEYKTLKANGMKFQVRAYRAQGLGWVSVMKAAGFFGLMKMDTLIINPAEPDMPLLSYDRVNAMGNDTLIYELYDTMEGPAALANLAAAKAAGAELPDHDLGGHWYDSIKLPESLSKKGKKAQTAAFDRLACSYMDAYLGDCKSAGSCDGTEKRKKASAYVEGLLSHGGPSTDVFKKAIGEEKTAELFRRVLFGTETEC